MLKTSIFLIIGLPILYLIGVLVYASATKFCPIDRAYLEKLNQRPPFMIADSVFSVISWNIGYGGLGKESDFFYDGGEQVRMDRETVKKNLTGIRELLGSSNADFICLQEVDSCSKRSYRINELSFLLEKLSSYEAIYAKNYDVNFVPRPFLNPLGKITSGLACFSKLGTTFPERVSYTSEPNFPNNLFMLRRCFMKIHIPLTSGKDLVIINTHNSAYDATGSMKKEELDILMPYIYNLYENGNYVVVAGDWNQCTPDYVTKGKESEFRESKFSTDFLNKGWKWSSDPSTPTNRKLNKVYDEKTSYTSVIDFFLISPNINSLSVKTIDTFFEFSDHQPVKMEFSLD